MKTWVLEQNFSQFKKSFGARREINSSNRNLIVFTILQSISVLQQETEMQLSMCTDRGAFLFLIKLQTFYVQQFPDDEEPNGMTFGFTTNGEFETQI